MSLGRVNHRVEFLNRRRFWRRSRDLEVTSFFFVTSSGEGVYVGCLQGGKVGQQVCIFWLCLIY